MRGWDFRISESGSLPSRFRVRGTGWIGAFEHLGVKGLGFRVKRNKDPDPNNDPSD